MSVIRESIGAEQGSPRLDQDHPRLGQGKDGAGLAIAGCGNGGTRAGYG